MFSSLVRLAVQWSRFLLVRVVLFAMLALVSVAASLFFGDMIPQKISRFVGEEAMNTIVNTLAASMLAVTTFSLSIMLAAYQSAAGAMTPRSRLVLRQDRVTQSVLATFVGAFVFSLVVIILRATPLIGEKERFLLFCATVIVVILVLVAMVRWIRRLETLGANDDTLIKLERHAINAMKNFIQSPALGAHVWSACERDEMEGAPGVRATRPGYVQQIMEGILQEVAVEHDLFVYAVVRTGDYVVPGQTLAYAEGLPEKARDGLRRAFYIRSERSFEQDPRLGVQVMTEVASRALSSAVNDPQTAVDVAHRLSAVFCQKAGKHSGKVTCGRVWVIPQDLGEMMRQSYGVIMRDAKGNEEVLEAARESLSRVARHGEERVAKLAEQMLEDSRQKGQHSVE